MWKFRDLAGEEPAEKLKKKRQPWLTILFKHRSHLKKMKTQSGTNVNKECLTTNLYKPEFEWDYTKLRKSKENNS